MKRIEFLKSLFAGIFGVTILKQTKAKQHHATETGANKRYLFSATVIGQQYCGTRILIRLA